MHFKAFMYPQKIMLFTEMVFLSYGHGGFVDEVLRRKCNQVHMITGCFHS